MSGFAANTLEASVWAKLMANRLNRLWYYLIKLRRNSPNTSESKALQELKDLMADNDQDCNRKRPFPPTICIRC